MVRCYGDKSDSRTTELVEVVRKACIQSRVEPIYIWICGSRLFNLNTGKSDWDFLIISKERGCRVQLYEPCKIDIFVHTLEDIKWHIENYNKTSFLRCLFLLMNILVHDELKNLVDYKKYCIEFLKECLVNKKLQIDGCVYKAIYYKYLLYYHVKHNFSFEFTDHEIKNIQMAHDRLLSADDDLSLNQQIINLLQEQKYIEF